MDFNFENQNPMFWADFYKFGHVSQYKKGIKKIWVNMTPRSTRVEGETGVIFFSLQRFILKYLIEAFNKNFFQRPFAELLAEYREFVRATLGKVNPKTDHIEALWDLGYLPIKIYALPEGTYVPLGCPALVLVNTVDEFFWIPNFLETIMSNQIWGACTSASTARRYRKVCEAAAKRAGETDLSFIDWQCHDFSMRGMFGFDACLLSGLGHLTSFSGTDTAPAILEAIHYYGATLNPAPGGSVDATEHSVMCAGSKDGEYETFKRLLTEVSPTGILSVVSDTWNLWNVLKNIVPRLRGVIHARDGKLVIRPDSGDPVKILTGDWDCPYDDAPESVGALRLLAEALGTVGPFNRQMINKGGLIYGDSITVERAERILNRTIDQGFSPYNMVFGVGSYTYQYVTRDTYNFAFKATAIEDETGIQAIYKDPVTDNTHKKSHRGIPIPYRALVGQGMTPGQLYWEESVNPDDLDRCAFRKVFEDSALLSFETLNTIKERIKQQ